ncbi:MAG: hypothetical protein WAW96_09215 [Alphaproteobacteria bacterium]
MTEVAPSLDDLKQALEKLVGEPCVRNCDLPAAAVSALQDRGSGLGYSQLNELLLLLGFDRITHSFFQFLVSGKVQYEIGAAIKTFDQLSAGVDRFRELGLLMYGNIKFAFKALSADDDLLGEKLEQNKPLDLARFQARHDPIRPIEPIAPDQTYYLGYLIERQLRDKLKANPADAAALAEEQKRKALVETGKVNQEAYLASDHLDVYVATSMRQRHEYVAVNRLANQIFSHP